jgi:hypothetical protein
VKPSGRLDLSWRRADRGGALDVDCRPWFFSNYYSISPGMVSQIPGKGAFYVIAFTDSDGVALTGGTNYIVTGFVARAQDGGFVIEATLGTEVGQTAILGNTRSGSRVFASLSTVAMLLKRLGFDRFVVDASQYVPGRVRAARPDRAAAMKAVKVVKTRGRKAQVR